MNKIAINGLGRIGKLVLQYLLESKGYGKDYEVVAVNDLSSVEDLAYSLKYDSIQVTMKDKGHTISYETTDADGTVEPKGYLIIDEHKLPVYSQPNPTQLPWGKLDVDVTCECTGRFATVEGASQHLTAGAKRVMVNAPVKGAPNVVYKINETELTKDTPIGSGASCTTNCLAPVAKALDEAYGIVKGMMCTVHSYTADQMLVDGLHKKGCNSGRGRAAGWNIVPTSTGAAEAVAKALPQLKGKLTGMAMRVPTLTGSVVVFDVELKGNLTAKEINDTLMQKADNESMSYTPDRVVSSDIVGCEYGSLVDLQSTKVLESNGETTMAQVVSWYDNEASYTHQYVKTLIYWLGQMK